jgi:hypothetical protein
MFVTVHDDARSERRALDASSRMPSSVSDVICIETPWESGRCDRLSGDRNADAGGKV